MVKKQCDREIRHFKHLIRTKYFTQIQVYLIDSLRMENPHNLLRNNYGL